MKLIKVSKLALLGVALTFSKDLLALKIISSVSSIGGQTRNIVKILVFTGGIFF